MELNLTVREATIADAKLLYKWRTDPRTMIESVHQESFSFQSHVTWLKGFLQADSASLLIFTDAEGIPVGTGRTIFEDDAYSLSWTVAPNSRGLGYGKQIVRYLVTHFIPSRAVIRIGNLVSISIARQSGLRETHRSDGYVFFARD